jgi:hypothetical protein
LFLFGGLGMNPEQEQEQEQERGAPVALTMRSDLSGFRKPVRPLGPLLLDMMNTMEDQMARDGCIVHTLSVEGRWLDGEGGIVTATLKGIRPPTSRVSDK